MNTPLLSLVVPVYNVAPYLPRCLESLAALTPAADEIIVVDDGATDDCPRILAEFAPRLPQMRVIRQENGGLSAARNTALEVARGKYLAFVDSDDFVAPDAYGEAIRLADEGQLDMVLLNANYHFEGRQADYAIYAGVEASGIVSGRDWLLQRLRAGRFLHMVWMHLYRREFIEANQFRFIPRLIHEDVIWTTQALLAARRVRYSGHVAVNYRIPIRQPSQQQLQAIVRSSVVNAETLATLAAKIDDNPELRQRLEYQLVDGALSVFHKLRRMPDRDAARRMLRQLRGDGFFSLLWHHAQNFHQRRRIARNWLKALFS